MTVAELAKSFGYPANQMNVAELAKSFGNPASQMTVGKPKALAASATIEGDEMRWVSPLKTSIPLVDGEHTVRSMRNKATAM